MALLVFISFYEYLTAISSPIKVRLLIEKDRALMFSDPRNIKQLEWNDKLENSRIKVFNEWLKVLEGKMTRDEFDRRLAVKG